MSVIRRLQSAVRARLHRQDGHSGSEPQCLTYDELLHLIYPTLSADDRLVVDAARGDGALGDPATIRRMLGSLGHQLAPTRVSVSFGSDDIVNVEVHDLELLVDAADPAVSSPIRGGTYEPHLVRVFEEHCKKDMVVGDVGANIGFYSVLAAQLVGAQGRVFAVEPDSENCRLLLSSARLNGYDSRIRLCPVACDANRGWAYFAHHVGSNGSIVADNDLLEVPGRVVPVYPLDDLIDLPVDLLKVDVEGAEARVIAGARRILEQDRPVIISELSQDMLQRVSDTSALDYLTVFEDSGYRMGIIDRNGRDPTMFSDARSLLEDWSDPYRIEDVLLLPD